MMMTCRPTRTRYRDSEPTSLGSFSLMPRAQWRSNKCQFYRLWSDSIVARTHNLPHSMRACQQYALHYRCGLQGNIILQEITLFKLYQSWLLHYSLPCLHAYFYHTYLVKRSEGIYNYLLISDSITSDQVYQLLAHGPLLVLRLPPPLKLVAMKQLKYCSKWR